MYRMPNPLTLDAARALMGDRRYQDKSHPEHGDYVKFVTDAFQRLYPEPEKKTIRIGSVTAEPDTIIPDTPPVRVAQAGNERLAMAAIPGDAHPGRLQGRSAQRDSGVSVRTASDWPDPMSPSELDPGHNRPRWPGSPANRVDPNYRGKLWEFESRKPGVDPYQAINREGGSMGALGKYGARKPVLQDAGIADKDGSWTGKSYDGVSVDSEKAFLGNDRAQEETLVGSTANNEKYMKSLGILGKDGMPSEKYKDRTIQIPESEGNVPVSEAGLYAAAHFAGAGGLRYYLQQVERNGWRSGPGVIPKDERIMGKDADPEDWRKKIEKRLRAFKASDRVWLY
ncbi:MAG: hypothetical protein ACYC1L_01945 [Alphaproteobacteria bacterium]